ncbi:MAG TPA: RNA-guided endonuclease TnpB family protein [Steroidobacteraceae bacterium]|jgi:IS605 OrfB family transposase|nr:RNA-guided endonuclease TnpB family protein [Steroidobacteraceae bacterium]
MILTHRYRLRETSGARRELSRQAKAVNFVWNFCGETHEAARRWDKRWPSGFDLIGLSHGVSRELQLHSDTVQAVCKQFAISRDSRRRRPRWRGRSSLGWIPFQAARAIRLEGTAVIFLKRRYRLWLSRPVEGKIKSGSFARDARGRWYLNLQVEVAERQDCGRAEVAIDLGLKDLATLSTGEKIANPRQLARYAEKLASAQRAGRKARARAIHAKIANCRRHFLHQLSARLVRENRRICVGNVNASRLARTSLAKSVLDAGWSQLRSQLRYKAMRHGAEYLEVDERFTTQVCSDCGAVSGPKGIAHLGVRDWICSECGVRHDRDINSSINILVSGRNAGLRLTEIPIL